MTVAYKLSFTTGGLFLTESVDLAASYLETAEWKVVVRDAGQAVSFSSAKAKSTQRVAREIVNRLSNLTQGELDFLVRDADRNEQSALLWLAICRTYRLAYEFAVEVISERYASYRREISPENYTAFVHDKAEWNAELASRTPATIERSRQVLFKIMREAGLLDIRNQICRMYVSPRLRAILRQSADDLGVFPGGIENGGRGI